MNFAIVSQDHAATAGGCDGSRAVDLDEPQLKEEILLLIANYLMENGFAASSHTLLDEAALKVRTLSKDRSNFRSMSKAVVAGNWAEVETLLKQVSSTNQGPKMKGLRYSVYRQQFLEMVDKGESQKAFTYLLGNLKPMPNISSEDLHALTVMLTCRNVAESDPSWPGVTASREALANQVLSLGVADLPTIDAPPDITQIVPPRRLNVLLEQAVMYQRSRSDAGSSITLPCRSLLRDYEVTGTPTQRIGCLRGDSIQPVKCVRFIGPDLADIATAGGGGYVLIWSAGGDERRVRSPRSRASSPRQAISQKSYAPVQRLIGHSGHIWDLACSGNDVLFSAGGDSTIRMWRTVHEDIDGTAENPTDSEASAVFEGHTRDVYSVICRDGGGSIVSSGYDRMVRLWDVATERQVKQMTGHEAAVTCVCSNDGGGSFVCSGSRDGSIRCWDLLSGLTVNIINDCGGEVTSVSCSGHLLVTAARNSTVRVIDMRMNKVLQRLRGSHNVSRNFIRASFGPGSGNVMCGSEDGVLHIWDPVSGSCVDKITASASPVYSGAWSAAQGMLACACHDGTVPLWGQSKRLDFVASPSSPVQP